MKQLLYFAFFICTTCISAQTSVVKIEGYAPHYIGQTVQLNEIEDYFSMKEATVASGTIQTDSTFSLSFQCNETKKMIVRIGNNRSFLYIQPNGNYSIYFPPKDQYAPYRPAGNQVEITFFDLDSTDINYQVLGFNRWLDNYLALNYKDHLQNPVEFMKRMDDFKEAAQKYYIKDTGKYIFDYVRFTLANVDNTQQLGNRNRYEKHDFYLKHQAVRYQNDAYMDYFKNFYKGMMPTIPMEVNNRVYLGLLKSSPTLIMNALGLEYTLINVRIRELVMIQMLSELYYSPEYPQTNIITVLDSVKTNALFAANKVVASNMIARLTEANSGGKAPQFFVKTMQGNTKGLTDYKDKFLYIHFFDPTSEKCKIEIPILKELYRKYQKEVNFLTICKESTLNEQTKLTVQGLYWDVAYIPDNSSMWSNYKVATFPNYVLIDPYSYIVQAPALGPQPNNLYETIDKVFFDIQKMLNGGKVEKK
jgi:thiol-disulfide isomerase/thioredoxin